MSVRPQVRIAMVTVSEHQHLHHPWLEPQSKVVSYPQLPIQMHTYNEIISVFMGMGGGEYDEKKYQHPLPNEI